LPTPAHKETNSLRTDIYSGCKTGTAVELNAVVGQGHAWPGGDRLARFLDAPSPDVHATDMMWAFFAQHPKP
jgi:polyhydroxybutyrate depolymerase